MDINGGQGVLPRAASPFGRERGSRSLQGKVNKRIQILFLHHFDDFLFAKLGHFLIDKELDDNAGDR